MPAGDGTGPAGAGPMTGRGMGYCNGFNVPGYMNRPGRHLYGRGFGAGRGWGRGPGRRVYSTPYPFNTQQAPAAGQQYSGQEAPESEMNFLRNRAAQLEDELKAINERLDELDSKDNEN